MRISGQGITPFTVKVRTGFVPRTKLAIKWKKLSSGNYAGQDRTSAEDVYETVIGFKEKEATLNTFFTEIEANRVVDHADASIITLDTFLADEQIFGENVTHTTDTSSPITATVMPPDPRQQNALNSWGVSLVLRATTVTLAGGSSLPNLVYMEDGPQADSDYTIRKLSNYDGTLSYQDHRADSGIFEGVFILSRANMILIRNYIQNQRTGNFSLADNFGIDYPFGPRSGNSYPFTTKLIDWEDMGYFGLGWSKIRLKFAEVV